MQETRKKKKMSKKTTYLGAIVCKEGGGMKDLKNRPPKARGAFIRLEKNLELQQHHKKNKTKTVQDTSGTSIAIWM